MTETEKMDTIHLQLHVSDKPKVSRGAPGSPTVKNNKNDNNGKDKNAKKDTDTKEQYLDFIDQPAETLFNVKQSTRYSLPSSRAATTGKVIDLKLEKDSIVEVELTDGGILFVRADELKTLVQTDDASESISTGSRGSANDTGGTTNHDTLILTSSSSLRGQPADSETSRGIVSDVIKAITTLEIDWQAGVATVAVEVIKNYIKPLEDRILGLKPGLLHWNPYQENNWRNAKSIPFSKQPVLILIHGTASSTKNCFGALWNESKRKQWLDFIFKHYKNRLYAFNHRSLSESPIQNAIELLDKLDKNQEVHLVSHSRGGLVGELLCRGDMNEEWSERDPISDDDINLYKSAYEGHLNSNRKRKIPTDILEHLDNLNSLLLEKRIKIKRFVRIACPSKGTTLADHRADLYLSILFSVLEKATKLGGPIISGLGSSIKALAITAAKSRMDFDKLPGLECMMPSSGLIKMINHSSIVVTADLTVIAGNAEKGKTLHATSSAKEVVKSLQQTLWVVLTNAFYLQENDFVVETTAMNGGHKRENPTYIYPDNGGMVNHFNYFTNPVSRQHLLLALSCDIDKKPNGFNFLSRKPSTQRSTDKETTIGRGAGTTTGTQEAIQVTRCIVVMIPGFGGTHLSVDGERIWVSTRNLTLGKLHKLQNDSKYQVNPEAWLENHYGKLATFLEKNHQQEVIAFPYDWRQSIADTSKLLATEIKNRLDKLSSDENGIGYSHSFGSSNSQENSTKNKKIPIRFLAHGMGGLVLHHMMLHEPELWNRLHTQHNSQCIMAGTPFSGHYEVVQILLQQSPLIHQISLLNPDYSLEKLTSVLSDLPSVLEMLPTFNEEAKNHKFYTQATWKQLHKDFKLTNPCTSLTNTKRLSSAKSINREHSKAPDSIQQIHYLAGQDDATPAGLTSEDNELQTGQRKTQFMSSSKGDGLTLWEQIPGWFDKNNIWYLPRVKHGDLLRHREHFAAIADILLNGTTALLAHTAPQSRGLAHKKLAVSRLKPHFLLPESKDIEALALHGSTTLPKNYQARKLAHVRIIHGDLRKIETPIMVGHYLQDGIRGSEAVVDKLLKGWLSELYNNNLYPGALNTVEVVIDPGSQSNTARSGHQCSKGAVVVGLGLIGELTTPILRRTLRNAFIRYGLYHAELFKHRQSISNNINNNINKTINKTVSNTENDEDTPLVVSTLLIGAGTGGVNVEDSVSSLLNALTDANKVLTDLQKPSITRLDIVELYEDIAISTAMSLHRMERLFKDSVTVDTIIKTFPGKQVRPTISAYETWWQHLQILGKSDGSLTFTPLTSSAGMQTTAHKTQTSLIDSILKQATKDTVNDVQLSRTLFELLLPTSLKENVRDENGMVLLLNEAAARFPWEMLVSEQSRDKPLSTEIGFIRKLHSADIHSHKLTRNNDALVIGDTESSLAELPGAQDEARIVHKALLDAGFCSDEALIRKSGLEIVSTIMSHPVQIMHLAGHGVFLEKGSEFEGKIYENGISGMVLGNNHFLTNDEIKSLPYIPELVFINCCHLGEIKQDDSLTLADCYFQSRSKLAANLGTAFIQAGAKCVVAAGWEVDDSAALLFADEFYHQILSEGEDFGEAVRLARKRTFDRYPGSNTWGAYQCYGDHKFKFKKRQYKKQQVDNEKHHSARQTIIWANNISDQIWTGNDAKKIQKSIDKRSENLPPEWQQNAELHESIASAYAATFDFSKATEWYGKAVNCNDSRITLKALEQKANVLVRWSEWDFNATKMVDSESGNMPTNVHDKKSTKKQNQIENQEQSIKHIDASIELLNKLVSIHETEERANMLASAYKHKAMILFISKGEITKDAKENLCLAYNNYMQANEIHLYATKTHGTYPLLNALCLWLGFQDDSCPKRSKDTKKNEFIVFSKRKANYYIKKLEKLVTVKDTNKDNDFWELTDNFNCKLVKALNKRKLNDDLCSELIINYREAFEMATPMNIDSVLKQIRFLNEYLNLAWKASSSSQQTNSDAVTTLINLKLLKEDLEKR